MDREEEIRRILTERGIEILLHFTQLDNLQSILMHGLRPRDELDETARCNDEHRLDRHTDTVSMSVHHPNDAMFFKYRSKLRRENPQGDWCVLAVTATVLLEQDALFCLTNAASSVITRMTEDALRTAASFRAMFEQIPGHASREDQHLNLNDPTDVQGEILVRGTIPPDRIFGIVFTSEAAQAQYQTVVGNRQTRVHAENQVYLSRRDYQRIHYNG